MKILAVLAALIVPPAVYFPTMARQNEQRQARADEELFQLDRRVQEVRSAQRKMPQFMEENARFASELEGLRVTLPPKLSTGEILRAVESAASSHGVRLTRFTPRPPAEVAGYQMVAIDAEADGNLAAIEALLREFGAEPAPGRRLLTVSEVRLAGEHSHFVVTGYALPDER